MTEIRGEYITAKPPQAPMTPDQRTKVKDEMRTAIIKMAQLWFLLFGGSWLDLMPRAERENYTFIGPSTTATLPDGLFDKTVSSGL